MSNSLAIAAVTTTLRYLLQRRFDSNGSGSVIVTTKPLDKARDNNNNGNGGNQVNLFLYQTQSNAAWRNMDIPTQVKPGETGLPPLALNLYYMLTTYAQNDDFPEPTSHNLLGEAML
ncbi:Pvc16 family protein, partial [Calothrix rhizosoleniae]|uniref:Pvc16 family protein n=1 Tax=Calothrix rhizosoleniae TaxID=888997 RepID=UPI00117822B0